MEYNHDTPPTNPEYYHIPRFTDELSPELTVAWDDLMMNIDASEKDIDNSLIEIWCDKELPSAFRDRALMLRLGMPPRYSLLSNSSGDRMRTFVPQQANRINKSLAMGRLDRFSSDPRVIPEEFLEWHKELKIHENKQGNEIVISSVRLLVLFDYYSMYKINEEDLSSQLEGMRIESGLGIFEYDMTSHFLQFPVLDQIPKRYGDSRIVEWARQHKQIWKDHMKDSTKPCPDWLKTINRDQERDNLTLLMLDTYDMTLDLWSKLKSREILEYFRYGPANYIEILSRSSSDEVKLQILKDCFADFDVYRIARNMDTERKEDQIILRQLSEAVNKFNIAEYNQLLDQVLALVSEIKAEHIKSRQLPR